MSSVRRPASDLLKRSHRLGSDARNTNYAAWEHVGKGSRG